MKRVVSLIIAVFFIFSSFGIAVTEEEKLKEQLNENNSQIDAKKGEIKQVENKKKSLLDEIEDLDKEMDKAQKELDSIQGQINSLNSQIKTRENKIKETDKKIEEENILLQKRVRAMYENGNTAYISLLLNSENITDFMKRCELAERMIDYDKELFAKLEQLKTDMNEEIKSLGNDKLVMEAAKQQELESKNKLSASISAKDSKVKLLEKDINELQRQLDRELEESRAIERQLRALSGTSTVVYKNEAFIWPTSYSKVITCKYGPRIHPVTKKQSTHTGIDIRAALDTSVYAAASGKVVTAGWNTAYGNMVIIDHGNGITTLYGHANKLLVKVGDVVNQGDTIMRAGSTGYSTGPHLHFEVRKNGTPQDPKNYLDYTGVTFK